MFVLNLYFITMSFLSFASSNIWAELPPSINLNNYFDPSINCLIGIHSTRYLSPLVMISPCASCGKAVYPTEKLNCLDRTWHKTCFKCQECGMTLNIKNHKGYEKKPYCKAHYPTVSISTLHLASGRRCWNCAFYLILSCTTGPFTSI